jgi:hypothetical protein
MKTITPNRFKIIIWLLAVVMGCQKNEPIVVPIFTTSNLDSPDMSYTFFDATTSKNQEQSLIQLVQDHGFVWSTNPSTTLENAQVISLGKMKLNTAFGSLAKDLIGNTTYYVRAYIKMNNQVYYANEISFKTRPGTWKKLSDFAGAGLVHATGFSINNKGYVVGGNQVWEYNPDTDSWSKKNDAPFSVEGPTSFVINNTGYVYCNSLWRYISNSDSWEAVTTTSYKGCKGISSFVLNGKAYIGSGIINLNQSFVEWDPATGNWTNPNYYLLSPNRSYAACFSLNNKSYVIGGEMWTYESTRSVIEYDLVNKQSTYQGAFINDRGYSTDRKEMISFVINGEAYVGLGYGEFPLKYWTDIGSQFDFYKYDLSSKSFIPQTYPVYVDSQNNIHFLERAGGVSFIIGNRAFIGLGENRKSDQTSTLYKDFWEFIPN